MTRERSKALRDGIDTLNTLINDPSVSLSGYQVLMRTRRCLWRELVQGRPR